jgi:glutaredoxin-like protein NrdH
MIELTHVEGKDTGKIVLYALSTCIWCRKTKKLLDSMKVAYDFVDVDLLGPDSSNEAQKEIRKWNPMCSFPTMVIDDKSCIVGFDEKKVKELAK